MIFVWFFSHLDLYIIWFEGLVGVRFGVVLTFCCCWEDPTWEVEWINRTVVSQAHLCDFLFIYIYNFEGLVGVRFCVVVLTFCYCWQIPEKNTQPWLKFMDFPRHLTSDAGCPFPRYWMMSHPAILSGPMCHSYLNSVHKHVKSSETYACVWRIWLSFVVPRLGICICMKLSRLFFM